MSPARQLSRRSAQTFALALSLALLAAAARTQTKKPDAPPKQKPVASAVVTTSQTTVFTYQGRLTSGASAATGAYQMQFALYDAAMGGTQIGSTITFDGAGGNPPAVQVTNGVFTVQLDFSASAFDGSDRFLEISVKGPSDSGYTTLAPRQQVTSTPYAIRSLNATNADTATNAQQLGGVAANQYALKTDTAPNSLQLGGVAASGYLQKSGGTMTGALDMGSGKITSLAAPTAPTDAANKSYVDSKAATNYFQQNWSDSPLINDATAWTTITGSQFSFTTQGGALLISTDLSLVGFGASTCQPIIDGKWAGTYGGLPGAEGPFDSFSWHEGVLSLGVDYRVWRKSRIYPGVPAGTHTFALQCATNATIPLRVCNAVPGLFPTASIACSWSVLELK